MPRYYDPLSMLDSNGRSTIRFDPEHGNVTLGGDNQDGDLSLLDRRGSLNIHLNGERASIILGGETEDGDLTLRNSDNRTAIHLSGNSGDVKAGGRGVNGDISVHDDDDRRTIHLQGSSGRIVVDGTALEVPDDVFADDYPLAALATVRDHIRERRHLPRVASRAEIRSGGLDLVQLSLDLLRKVEELTLYVLQQQDRIEALEATARSRNTA